MHNSDSFTVVKANPYTAKNKKLNILVKKPGLLCYNFLSYAFII